MDVFALNTFVDVANAGSFAASARKNGLDPSQVSRTIAGLEDELGFRLFQRSTRRLALTEAGQEYLSRIAPLIEELELAKEQGQSLTQQPQGALRVTASVAFGVTCIVPLLREFKTLHPKLKVDLVLNDLVLDLIGENIDLAVRLSAGNDYQFIGRKLMNARYLVCASPAYLREAPPLKHPNDLSQHDCVVFPLPGYRNRWHVRKLARTRKKQTEKSGKAQKASQQGQEEFDINIRSGTIISTALGLHRAAIDGLGPALLPDWLANQAIASGELIHLFPENDITASDFQTAVWMIYPSRKYQPLKVRVFMDFLKARLGQP
jgi:DNA-binding transcriptional LysR family regulator